MGNEGRIKERRRCCSLCTNQARRKLCAVRSLPLLLCEHLLHVVCSHETFFGENLLSRDCCPVSLSSSLVSRARGREFALDPMHDAMSAFFPPSSHSPCPFSHPIPFHPTPSVRVFVPLLVTAAGCRGRGGRRRERARFPGRHAALLPQVQRLQARARAPLLHLPPLRGQGTASGQSYL